MHKVGGAFEDDGIGELEATRIAIRLDADVAGDG